MSNIPAQTATIEVQPRIAIQDALNLVRANGHNRTYLLAGTPGIGKTQRIIEMARQMGYLYSILDAASMDIGELAMPYFEDVDGIKVTKFGPNARLMTHLKRPVVIFVDELGKANPIVMNALLPLLLEHRIGDFTLPDGSIVVAATNLATDGLGDRIPGHAYNRVTELLVRGPTADEWIKWAVSVNLPAGLIAAVKQTPSFLQEYWQGESAERNAYIFNPTRGQIRNFTSARSLAGVAHEVALYSEGQIDSTVFRVALTGALGRPAADTMISYLEFGSRLPSLEEVVANPTMALNKAMQCMSGQHLMVANLAMRVNKTMAAAVGDFVGMIRENNMQEASVLFARMVTQRQDSGITGVKETPQVRKLFLSLAQDIGS